jgi:hypothetical protein
MGDFDCGVPRLQPVFEPGCLKLLISKCSAATENRDYRKILRAADESSRRYEVAAAAGFTTMSERVLSTIAFSSACSCAGTPNLSSVC